MSIEVIIAFISERRLEFTAEIRGVSEQELEDLQAGCGVRLPRAYLGFLRRMGVHSNGFHPFGPSHVMNLYALVEELPAETYPAERFFKIAEETNRSLIVIEDKFLDLQRSDGDDAPLVRFEDGGEFEPKAVAELGFSFREQLTRSAFLGFELEPRKHRRVIGLEAATPVAVEEQLRAATEMLTKMSLVPVLEWTPRVRTLRNETLSAMLEHRGQDRALSMRLGADDERALGIATEQLLDHLTGAWLRGEGKILDPT